MEKEFTIEKNGKEYKGWYKIEKGMIHVSSGFGSKSAQLGGSTETPEVLARIILGELISEDKN